MNAKPVRSNRPERPTRPAPVKRGLSEDPRKATRSGPAWRHTFDPSERHKALYSWQWKHTVPAYQLPTTSGMIYRGGLRTTRSPILFGLNGNSLRSKLRAIEDNVIRARAKRRGVVRLLPGLGGLAVALARRQVKDTPAGSRGVYRFSLPPGEYGRPKPGAPEEARAALAGARAMVRDPYGVPTYHGAVATETTSEARAGMTPRAWVTLAAVVGVVFLMRRRLA